jgi:hypothetical protein
LDNVVGNAAEQRKDGEDEDAEHEHGFLAKDVAELGVDGQESWFSVNEAPDGRATKDSVVPVYVRRYAVTIQSRMRKPSRAFVIETSDVLTMVVSKVERKRARRKLWFVQLFGHPTTVEAVQRTRLSERAIAIL